MGYARNYYGNKDQKHGDLGIETDMEEGASAFAEIKAHQRECAVRYENIERRLEEGRAKFHKLEMLLWGVYPFIVATIIAAKFL